MESSHASPALEESVRVHLAAAFDRLGVEAEDLPEPVVERVGQRARLPGHRLVIGRYLITGELGRGGMGVVYEAWDPGIERKVAIKTIEPELVPEDEREEVVERFRRETKIVGRLHHRAIVTIYDSGREKETDPITGKRVVALYYYVMEYLEGHSLARVLKDRQALSEQEAVRIAADIAEALQLSHDAGIIHRDIKPSNIFLRDDTDAVLLDFGIAKTGSVGITRQGQILGTPSYLAPERLREKEVAIDGRADIFSLGVLLFTMISGEAPFVGEDVYDVIDKIAKERHPSLSRSTPAKRSLAEAIDRMLAKDPDGRYGSAREAAQALRQLERMIEMPIAPTPGEILGGAAARRIEPGKVEQDDENTGPILEDSSAAEKGPTDPSVPAETASALEQGAGAVSRRGPPPPPPKSVVTGNPMLAAPESFSGEEATADEFPVSRALLEMKATEVDERPASVAPPPEIMGTRPELALSRQTRELVRDQRPTADMPSIGEGPDFDTSPSMPPEEPDTGDYEEHGKMPEENTDDETIADPELRAQDPAFAPENLREDSSRPVPRAPSVVRHSRIEASLVDEADVVVQPAPLDDLKPDELPTQTGFQLPAPGAQAAASVVGESDVVRARGDSRVPDPAESGGAIPVVVGQAAPPKSVPISKPAREIPRRSAAVARRTIGAKQNKAQPSGGNVQVRVTGKGLSGLAGNRIIKRRLLFLAAGMLLAVPVGLLIARVSRDTQAPEPAPEDSTYEAPPAPGAAPAGFGTYPTTGVRRIRLPSEILADARDAHSSGNMVDARRLYSKVIEQADKKSDLMAEALLGIADIEREEGNESEAIARYLRVKRGFRGRHRAQAQVQLKKMGYRPPVRAPTPPPPPTKAPPRPPPPPVEAAPASRKPRPPATATVKEWCRFVTHNFTEDERGAIESLREARRKFPSGTCVLMQLGNRYERTGSFTLAIRAFQDYLTLEPDTARRGSLERKIKNLQAKLNQRR